MSGDNEHQSFLQQRTLKTPKRPLWVPLTGIILTLGLSGAFFIALHFGLPRLRNTPAPRSRLVFVDVLATHLPRPKMVLSLHFMKVRLPKVLPPDISIQSHAPLAETIAPETTRDPVYLAEAERRVQKFSDPSKNPLEGIACVGLIIDRTGNEIFLTIAKSSGSKAFDQAALAQVRRAEPLPPVPAGVKSNALYLQLPLCSQRQDSAQACSASC